MITCEFEDGGKGNLRHVTVVILAFNTSGQILLVKRASNMWNGNKYTIPGGFLDRDETTSEGAIRELYEETGLTGKNLKLFRINDTKRSKEDRQNVDIIYATEDISGDVKTDKEVVTVEWFNENNLPPEKEFAFDHRESIVRYFEYKRNPFALPILG